MFDRPNVNYPLRDPSVLNEGVQLNALHSVVVSVNSKNVVIADLENAETAFATSTLPGARMEKPAAPVFINWSAPTKRNNATSRRASRHVAFATRADLRAVAGVSGLAAASSTHYTLGTL